MTSFSTLDKYYIKQKLVSNEKGVFGYLDGKETSYIINQLYKKKGKNI